MENCKLWGVYNGNESTAFLSSGVFAVLLSRVSFKHLITSLSFIENWFFCMGIFPSMTVNMQQVQVCLYHQDLVLKFPPYTLRRNSSLYCISTSKPTIQLYKDSSTLFEMKMYSWVSCFF